MILTIDMASFVREQLKTGTLADRLSAARKASHSSLDVIIEITQVQERYLLALEEGRYSALPSDVYVRGFLRSLAAFYKLDGQELIQQFQKERSVQRRIRRADSSLDDGSEERGLLPSVRSLFPRFIVTPRVFLIVTLGIFFIGVFGYLLYQIGLFTSAPTIVLERPDRDITITNTTFEIMGTTDMGVGVVVNGQDVFVEQDGRFSTTLTLQRGLNDIVVLGTNSTGKETTITRTIYVE